MGQNPQFPHSPDPLPRNGNNRSLQFSSDPDQRAGEERGGDLGQLGGAFGVAGPVPAGDHAHDAADAEGDGVALEPAGIPPGGRWPAPAGRKRNAGGNLKVGRMLQTSTSVATKTKPWRRPSGYHKSSGYRPHSSSVIKTVLWDRFYDSFPPGEAFGVLPHQ